MSCVPHRMCGTFMWPAVLEAGSHAHRHKHLSSVLLYTVAVVMLSLGHGDISAPWCSDGATSTCAVCPWLTSRRVWRPTPSYGPGTSNSWACLTFYGEKSWKLGHPRARRGGRRKFPRPASCPVSSVGLLIWGEHYLTKQPFFFFLIFFCCCGKI